METASAIIAATSLSPRIVVVVPRPRRRPSPLQALSPLHRAAASRLCKRRRPPPLHRAAAGRFSSIDYPSPSPAIPLPHCRIAVHGHHASSLPHLPTIVASPSSHRFPDFSVLAHVFPCNFSTASPRLRSFSFIADHRGPSGHADRQESPISPVRVASDGRLTDLLRATVGTPSPICSARADLSRPRRQRGQRHRSPPCHRWNTHARATDDLEVCYGNILSFDN
uniref:Uncharacterized protein n=1 Tax=Oryza barthii TaxID=65489 RepID=A0A0D3F586_9ORYZ